MGTHPMTERNRQILDRAIAGESYLQLARAYGVSKSRIGQILRNQGGFERLSQRSDGRQSREQIRRFILEYKASHQGSTPSIRRIRDGCGITSTSATYYHLKRLAQSGQIEILSEAGRNLEVAIPGARWVPPAEV